MAAICSSLLLSLPKLIEPHINIDRLASHDPQLAFDEFLLTSKSPLNFKDLATAAMPDHSLYLVSFKKCNIDELSSRILAKMQSTLSYWMYGANGTQRSLPQALVEATAELRKGKRHLADDSDGENPTIANELKEASRRSLQYNHTALHAHICLLRSHARAANIITNSCSDNLSPFSQKNDTVMSWALQTEVAKQLENIALHGTLSAEQMEAARANTRNTVSLDDVINDNFDKPMDPMDVRGAPPNLEKVVDPENLTDAFPTGEEKEV